MSVPQYRKQNYDIQQNIDDAMNNNIDEKTKKSRFDIYKKVNRVNRII